MKFTLTLLLLAVSTLSFASSMSGRGSTGSQQYLAMFLVTISALCPSLNANEKTVQFIKNR